MSNLWFTKMHGVGNDYIYFDCTKQTPEQPEMLSRRLSDRHFGVGGDGIVLILPSDKADFRMRMFNADGSEGKMCGNACRCIGKYVYEKGLTEKTNLTLETLSGIKTLQLFVTDGTVNAVTVDMGSPEFSPAKIPALTDDFQNVKISIGAHEYQATLVSMGNPHCVIFTEDVKTAPVCTDGPLIETLPLFPEQINVEFVHVVSETELEMRVWERGSGETLACGTGACASVAAAVVCGHCPNNTDISVRLTGGTLTVRYSEQTLWMTGPAEFVFEGKLL